MSSTPVIMLNNNKNEVLGNTEIDDSTDPASGGFFQINYKKHDDLKEMLDANKDSLKLEAMKRIIGMIAKGKDASDLFPAVVKNVVSKNIELKKLVYTYLVRYAEEQQDLALLSISTFQRALKEPNQLIRAGALRVLSSIRVSMIVPIVMLAIRDASGDMSPYVRKTAAHAIPKLYSLDPEQKPELVLVIQKLLGDRAVLVVGSAVMAYTEVCPDQIELIHQVFRKLCALLVDIDEWGQVVIINMLTRYARSQFQDPNINGGSGNIVLEVNNSDSDVSFSEKFTSQNVLDPDHRLLLRSARPLLQSRNSAVVMAVVQLYHHCGPKNEAIVSARALIRFLHSYTEVQSVVLDNIASISAQNKGTFEPFLKKFFIRSSDPTTIKLLKLDVLTHLVSETNVTIILRELQTYIASNDKQFVAATIQAIGRCACSISHISDSCLTGLVTLMSNKNEAVVAESVVVIKRLLQTRPGNCKEIIVQMIRILDNITVAQARAAILWLLGERLDDVKLVAPDVLRKLSKTFIDEDDTVKLQVLNLCVKLYIQNPDETDLISQYIFNLARYDQNFDVRDRARLLKAFTQNSDNKLLKQAERVFLNVKPAPALESQFAGREQFQIGSLSHFVNAHAANYEPLPPFSEIFINGEIRDVDCQDFVSERSNIIPSPLLSSSSYNTSSENETQSDEEDEHSDSENSGLEEDRSHESFSVSSCSPPEGCYETLNSARELSNIDLLLDINLSQSNTPRDILNPILDDFMESCPNLKFTPASVISPPQEIELLNHIKGNGLGVTFHYTRSPHLYSTSMVSINLTFINTCQDEIKDIHLGKRGTSNEIIISGFVPIGCLRQTYNQCGMLGITFNDSTNPATFEIVSSKGSSWVQIIPNVGELIRPTYLSEESFSTERLRLKGMNEYSATIPCCSDMIDKVFKVANLAFSRSSYPNVHRFAGTTLGAFSIVLVDLMVTEESINLTVNCENIVIASLLLNELKVALK